MGMRTHQSFPILHGLYVKPQCSRRLLMVFKLGQSAQKNWQKLRGFQRLADVIHGIRFVDGIDERTLQQAA
jgi:hypothetical protein